MAASSSLSNVIAGALVSVAQPFRVGDTVVFNSGMEPEYCFVEDIPLMYTSLRTWDKRRLLVPNSMFQNNVVVNYTAKAESKLVPIYVTIDYESDMDRAMQILHDAAARPPDFAPVGNLPVVVMQYTNTGVSLRLLSNARDQSSAFNMTCDLLYSVRKEFDANGIRMAPSQRLTVNPVGPGGTSLLEALRPGSRFRLPPGGS
jgi:small conductance mechanosensitive channel